MPIKVRIRPKCLCGSDMESAMTSRYYYLYECPVCLRLLIRSRLTTHQKWFRPEDFEEVNNGSKAG